MIYGAIAAMVIFYTNDLHWKYIWIGRLNRVLIGCWLELTSHWLNDFKLTGIIIAVNFWWVIRHTVHIGNSVILDAL